MYQPDAFRCDDHERLFELIRAYPLATVVTSGVLDANHLPWVLRQDGVAPRLTAHVPRANPLSRCDDIEALLIFHGPQAYVSPSWYPGKAEHGRVVPTWNYAVVHAFGRLRRVDDRGWLRAQLDQLTTEQEAPMPRPWSLAEAPADYTEGQLNALVGLELEVARLEGKFKLSQNHPVANRSGVIAGLRDRAGHGDHVLADLMESQEKNP